MKAMTREERIYVALRFGNLALALMAALAAP